MKTLVSKLLLLIFICLSSHTNLKSQILLNECKIEVESNGKKRTTQTYRIQINNKESNWLAEIGIRHDPKQKFTFKYAAIYDKHGKEIRKLKKKEISTRNLRSSMAFFQDDMISEFNLFHPTYPYTIEYSYEIIEDEYINLEYWIPRHYSRVPTHNGKLEIITPKDYPIKIEENGPFTKTVSFQDNTTTYSWAISSTEEIKTQIFAPTKLEIYPYVKVVPKEFKYGVKGSNASWKGFGQWVHNLNQGTDDLPEIEKVKLKQMTQGMTDKREIIKKVYHYLQDHTQYVLVKIDEGGLQSFPASYVTLNKHGDCKALSTYMKSMLNALDIQSYYTLIEAGNEFKKLNSTIPSPQFNHVILTVPMDKDTLWIENTSSTSPFNYAGTFIQNRKALAIDSLDSKLLHSPSLSTEQVLVEMEMIITQTEEEKWTADAKLNIRGNYFEQIRMMKNENSEEGMQSSIEEIIGIADFELNDWQFIDFHRDSTNIKIRTKGICKHPLREIADMRVINPLQIKIAKFEKPNDRMYDVRIYYPINEQNTLTYKFKDIEASEIQIPKPFFVESEYGTYATEYKRVGNNIEVLESFILFEGSIPLANYGDFYQFISSIIKHKKQSAIILQ